MNLKKTQLIVLTLLVISGCTKPQTEVVTVAVDKPTLIVPRPQELSLRLLTWKVITKDNATTVFETGPSSYMALDTDSYSNLALNMQDIKNYLIKQQRIIKAYKDYYE